MSQSQVDQLAQLIWDYHHVHHQLKPADAIFVLGSHDPRVAEYAIDLFKKGFAPYIIFSGGFGNLTKGVFTKPEAELFADMARRHGVRETQLLVESKSTNTGENIQFTKQVLSEKNLHFNSFILVQKPYMERRTLATFQKLWSEKQCIVTSPPISHEDYPNDQISKDEMINIMIGDLQRIKVYPKRGFQTSQVIPDKIWKAYEQLVALGFNKHLIKN